MEKMRKNYFSAAAPEIFPYRTPLVLDFSVKKWKRRNFFFGRDKIFSRKSAKIVKTPGNRENPGVLTPCPRGSPGGRAKKMQKIKMEIFLSFPKLFFPF